MGFIKDFFNKKKEEIGQKSFIDFNSHADSFSSSSLSFQTPASHLDAYTQIPILASCIDDIVLHITRQKIKLFNGENELKNLSNDQNKVLKDLKKNLGVIIRQLLLTGNAFLLKSNSTVYAVSKKTPDELRFISAERVTLRDGNYFLDGIKKIEEEDLIHFKINCLKNEKMGTGFVEKLKLVLINEVSAMEFANSMNQTYGKPSCFVVDKETASSEEMLRRSRIVRKNYKDSQGQLMYANGNLDIKELSQSFQDLQFTESRDLNQSTIMELFSCYKLTDSTNRATAEIKRLKFLDSGVNLYISILEEELNGSLFLDGINIRIDRYQTSDIENLIKLFQFGVISQNELRQRIGMEKTDSEYGDSYFFPSSQIPEENLSVDYSFEESSDGKSDDKQIVEILTKTWGIPRSKINIPKKRFQKTWLRNALSTKDFLGNKIFFKIREVFLDGYKEIKKDFNNKFNKKDFILEKKETKETEEDFISLKTKNKIKRDLKKALVELGLFSKNEVIKSLNKIIKRKRLDSGDPIFEDLTNNFYSKYSKNIYETLSKKILKKVYRGIEDGKTIPEINSDIFDDVSGKINKSVSTIARTEAFRYHDAISERSFKLLDVKKVDVVGCFSEVLHDGTDCGRTGIPLSEVSNLSFHPNHVGSLAPAIEV